MHHVSLLLKGLHKIYHNLKLDRMLVFSDLTGKILNFPKDSNTDYVKLIPTNEVLKAITVCLRYEGT